MARSKRRERVSARRRAEERGSEFASSAIKKPDNVEWFKVKKEGTKRLDFLCYVVGKGNKYADEGDVHFERTYWAHRNVGPNNEMVVCPAKTNGSKCPICEARTKLSNDPNADEDEIKNLAPKERQLWLLYDLGDLERGLQIWDVSYHLFGRMLENEIKDADEDDEYEFFADMAEGLTVRVGFDEESFGGRTFTKARSFKFKPRATDYSDELDDMPCLDDLLILRDYDDLKKLYLQTEEDDDDDDEEEEKPKRRRSSKPKKEEAKDNDNWDDDDEEEKPKRRRSSKAKKEEPEEEDDDDWDDEDDERPTRRRGNSGSGKSRAGRDDEDDEEDEDTPSKKSTRSARGANKSDGTSKRESVKTASRTSPSKADDDWDDDDWDD